VSAVRAETRASSLVAAISLLVVSCGTDVIHLDSHVVTPPPKPECVAIPTTGGMLCAYCGADYSVLRACLKCQPPSNTATCETCTWSDMTGAQCNRCVDATGAASTVGCIELRLDLMIPAS
jgi:hypothetical protein